MLNMEDTLITARRRVAKALGEDGAQDVMITLWRALESGKLTTQSEVGRYLTIAIRNQKCWKWSERHREAIPASGFEFDNVSGEGVESLTDKLDILAANAGWHDLDRSGLDYGDLTPEQLHLVNLMEEGYLQVEIAAILGIAQTTVGQRIRRLAKQLRK